ncbi:hypothetical protein N7463_000624 [Penicillium fimorum]|uniref:Uncharacterized protein n=1 Tax=Penicillium fimorum TaxID=1882269 RepID=A0A9W9Y4U2_9EURO|nr:hypothetical protein N7463_000624 [Penicillium fimorum]
MAQRKRNLAESKNRGKNAKGSERHIHQDKAGTEERYNQTQLNRSGNEGHLSINQNLVKVNLCE